MAAAAKDLRRPGEDDGKKSRTIYLTDAEWEQIVTQAEGEGRKAGRHIVFVIQERGAKK